MVDVSSALVAGEPKMGKSSTSCLKNEEEVVCDKDEVDNKGEIILDLDEDEFYTTEELERRQQLHGLYGK